MSFKAKEKDAPFPSTLGACADEMYRTREARLALQKEVQALQERETALKNHIIDTMPKSEGGAVGKLCRVTIRSKETVRVTDWEAFWAYIYRNRKTFGPSLMQRRVAEGAVKELWGAGRTVSGTEPFTVLDLSVNKL